MSTILPFKPRRPASPSAPLNVEADALRAFGIAAATAAHQAVSVGPTAVAALLQGILEGLTEDVDDAEEPR